MADEAKTAEKNDRKTSVKSGDASSFSRDLTPKQRAFVAAYLSEPAKWNATRAAEAAGYAEPNKQGPRLLVNVGIKAAISAALDELAMPANEVLERIAEIARSSLEDFIDDAGEIDVVAAKRAGKAQLLKSYSIAETKYGTTVRVEQHDRLAALALLGKAHGVFVEKVDHSGRLDLGIDLAVRDQSTQELAAWRQQQIAALGPSSTLTASATPVTSPITMDASTSRKETA